MRRKIVVLISLFMILLIAIGCQSGDDSGPQEGIGPVGTPIPLTAVISDIRGEIIAKQAGDSEFQIAYEGFVVNSSGQVATGADSRVKLTLSDDTIVRLGSNSFFTLDFALMTADGQANNVDLDVGKIWVVLQGGSIDIDTESGMASVRGSYLSVQVTATGEVYVTCLEGDCTITTGFGVIHLVAGQSALITGVGQPPTPGAMSEEDVEDWLNNNPEATIVIPALTQTAAAYSDDDYDGVPNDLDLCPNQGDQGFGVDADGCPYPVPDGDADGDGVNNSDDSCPLLGDQGYGVDELGCPNPYPDQDGDGYPDSVDACPNAGDEGYGVDAYGCPNPVDSDGDGFPDFEDLCPYAGDLGNGLDDVGCPNPADSDGDGVPDDVDACPFTGDLGNGVDEFGCPIPVDTDGDGVPDVDDLCDEGDLGNGVDADGCPIPVDTDGDGVPDDVDSCPDKGDLGAGLFSNGCPIPPDSDGDGIVDLYDLCPYEGDQGYGLKPNGCPKCSDKDKDGVCDDDDKCPNQGPACISGIDSDGCPNPCFFSFAGEINLCSD